MIYIYIYNFIFILFLFFLKKKMLTPVSVQIIFFIEEEVWLSATWICVM
jgi:hypothetical protein